MDLEKEQAKYEDLIHKAEEITAVAEGEQREVSKEEHRTWEDLMAQADQTMQRIEREQRILAAKARAERSHQEPTRPDLSGGTSYAQPKKFRSAGEQYQAIVRASAPGGWVDPRLIEMRVPTGLGEDLGSHGAFLLQDTYGSEILQNVYADNQVVNRCRRITLTGNSNTFKIPGVDETSRANGSRWGGVQSYWTAEAGAKTGSQPHFKMLEVTLNKLTGLIYVTDELLADAPALGQFLQDAMTQEIRFRLLDAIINGTGVGQPLGIGAGAGHVTVAANGGVSTFLPEDAIDMYSRMFADSRSNAVWLINQNVEPQLFKMGLAVGAGGSLVYMPPGGLSQAPYGTLFGRPVIPIEQCPGLTNEGDVWFVDLSQYLLVDKGGMQTASSIHVNFVNDETAFRFVYRVGGIPIWSAPLTPFGGLTTTLSPYVNLATR